MKPYVNFDEYMKNKEVQQAMRLLENWVFNGNELCWKGELLRLSWSKVEQIIVCLLGLKGRNKALFIGHSQRWGNYSLV